VRLSRIRCGLGWLAALGLLLPGLAGAADDTEERLSTVERAVEVLSTEQDRLRTAIALPEEGELESFGGLGPAASKVYSKEKGLSIGGYGEWRGRIFIDDNSDDLQNQLDAVRAVLYLGYKFNQFVLVNSELEFEHAGTGGGGDVSTEFLTLDFLLHQAAPSTWRENGAGIFGELFERVSYRVYLVNGLQASGFDSNGFRSGRQKGSEALADHFAVVGRVDVMAVEGVVVGGSIYAGNPGQNEILESGMKVPDSRLTIWEVHAEAKRYGASLRGLFAQSQINHADDLNNALDDDLDDDLGLELDDGIATRMRGGYVEVAYELLQNILVDSEMTLEPFYRFEILDTQAKAAPGFSRNRERDRTLHVVGFSFKPHPQVVLKLDYRNIASDGGGGIADEVQFGFGFVF
jgi:hypothetical protein